MGYVHRAVIYPLFRMPSNCAPMPVSVMLLAFLFCCWNGFTQSISLLMVERYPKFADDEFAEITRLMVGGALFFTGFGINIWADAVLMGLKSSSGGSIATATSSADSVDLKTPLLPLECADALGQVADTTKKTSDSCRTSNTKYSTVAQKDETATATVPKGQSVVGRAKSSKYKIPYGGLFRYVSCANYTGELLEWFGFFVCCWNLASFAFFLYTFANLGPRARRHHHWYMETFGEEYGKLGRKAIIPGVW